MSVAREESESSVGEWVEVEQQNSGEQSVNIFFLDHHIFVEASEEMAVNLEISRKNIYKLARI